MAEKKLLLVDTNVISHALSPNQIQCYIDLFKKLEKEFRFIVTGFTKYELLRSSDQLHRKEIVDYLEQNMARVDLSDILIQFTARLYYLYGKHPDTKGRKITDGDIINAAFAIAKDCAVLTIDNTDYPRVFFAEKERHRVTYESKGTKKETTGVIYLLTPDISKIKECFEFYGA